MNRLTANWTARNPSSAMAFQAARRPVGAPGAMVSDLEGGGRCHTWSTRRRWRRGASLDGGRRGEARRLRVKHGPHLHAALPTIETEGEPGATGEPEHQAEQDEEIPQRLIWIDGLRRGIDLRHFLRSPGVINHGRLIAGADGGVGRMRARSLE